MISSQLYCAWQRSAANFHNAHQKLEEELTRMRERKVAQDFIDKKDDQIDQLVAFYNQTDEIIQAYRHALIQIKLENHFLTEMLSKKISLQELMAYKPSRATQIINNKTGERHNLSELNG